MNLFAILLSAIFCITTNPGENCGREMNVSWSVDAVTVESYVTCALETDSWDKAVRTDSRGRYCAAYNNVWSKKADGQNFYEDARFFKHELCLKGLRPDTRYKYRVYAVSADGDTAVSDVYRFRTGGASRWKACVISDFHCYPPLPKRLEAAMGMMDVMEKRFGYDWVINLGDVCAWGGSHSFWKEMYTERQFRDHMWAGVNGNHDNMTRNYVLSNEFFKNATANPLNGYDGEMGVCYWFRYGDALFVMLNNEDSREGVQSFWVYWLMRQPVQAYD